MTQFRTPLQEPIFPLDTAPRIGILLFHVLRTPRKLCQRPGSRSEKLKLFVDFACGQVVNNIQIQLGGELWVLKLSKE